MVFTIKILVLASLASATEKENGYYVTVENVSVTLIGKYRIPISAEYVLREIPNGFDPFKGIDKKAFITERNHFVDLCPNASFNKFFYKISLSFINSLSPHMSQTSIVSLW